MQPMGVITVIMFFGLQSIITGKENESFGQQLFGYICCSIAWVLQILAALKVI